MTIAIDFDNTIVEESPFPAIGKIKPYAPEVINAWYDAGHTIIIWTCRDPLDTAMIETLYNYGIKYHSINSNYKCAFATSQKIYADVYIDDRQLGGIPDDWRVIKTIFENEYGSN